MTSERVAQHLVREIVDEKVLVLTMDDPHTRNSLTGEDLAAMEAEVGAFAGSRELRCLVITGAGGAFSSGANMQMFQRAIDHGTAPQRNEGPRIVRLLHDLRKPTIAAVGGPAYGVGCGIALSCDLRVASESARFSEAFIRSGLVPGDGSTWQLPKLIGVANTLLMQYTGDPVGAADALRLGLVSRVVAEEVLLPDAIALATRLANGPVFAMGLTKELVQRGFGQSFGEHVTLAAETQAITRQSYDHREGVAAFLEKREPHFRGE